MSSDQGPVLSIRDLGKRYTLFQRPRDRLLQMASAGLARLGGGTGKKYGQEFWALRDVALDLYPGDSLGIIGRNGSGKSTLLQLICGTLNPTRGSIAQHGRVAALLELGAGFNPEFSGRENIILNATLLGLDERQICERLDDILAFADIGDYIDQPVKSYSSGMYVRLAFAVIAHVDADILVIDEALAVGDAVFTQRCMRFIREFQQRGTLLFVSHDDSAVRSLCDRALWLCEGSVQELGPADTVLDNYLRFTQQQNQAQRPGSNAIDYLPINSEQAPDATATQHRSRLTVTDNLQRARGWQTGKAEITAVALHNLDRPGEGLNGGERVCLRIEALAHQRLESPLLGFVVKNRLGQDLFGENTLAASPACAPVSAGQRYCADFVFRLPVLPQGEYAVTCSAAQGNLQDNIQHHFLHDACIFSVSSSSVRWGMVGIACENVRIQHQDD